MLLLKICVDQSNFVFDCTLTYLGSDVFENAKYSSMFKICYLGDEKCFFQKLQISQFGMKKLTKLIL